MDDKATSIILNLDQLDQYFAGELRPDEAAHLQEWIDSDIEIAQCVQAIRSPWTPPGRTMIDVDAAFHNVRNQYTDRVQPVQRQRRAGRRMMPILASLATIMVAIGGAWFAFHQTQTFSNNHGAQWKSYVTARGQRGEVYLADGTKVTLAPDTRIRVRQDGLGADRHVELTGSAYFDVVHDIRRPFVVRTADGIIEELGTAFAVETMPSEHATHVVVTSGRVTIRSFDSASSAIDPTSYARVLSAGDAGVIERSGLTSVTNNVNVPQMLAWLRGEHHFVSAPLSRIVATIERWYDVRVEYANPEMARIPLTIDLPNGSIDEIFELITQTLNLQFERRGNATIRLIERKH